MEDSWLVQLIRFFVIELGPTVSSKLEAKKMLRVLRFEHCRFSFSNLVWMVISFLIIVLHFHRLKNINKFSLNITPPGGFSIKTKTPTFSRSGNKLRDLITNASQQTLGQHIHAPCFGQYKPSTERHQQQLAKREEQQPLRPLP